MSTIKSSSTVTKPHFLAILSPKPHHLTAFFPPDTLAPISQKYSSCGLCSEEIIKNEEESNVDESNDRVNLHPTSLQFMNCMFFVKRRCFCHERPCDGHACKCFDYSDLMRGIDENDDVNESPFKGALCWECLSSLMYATSSDSEEKMISTRGRAKCPFCRGNFCWEDVGYLEFREKGKETKTLEKLITPEPTTVVVSSDPSGESPPHTSSESMDPTILAQLVAFEKEANKNNTYIKNVSSQTQQRLIREWVKARGWTHHCSGGGMSTWKKVKIQKQRKSKSTSSRQTTPRGSSSSDALTDYHKYYEENML